MPFKVGDKSVHPHHGVGEVTAIEAKEIGGQKKTFYILKIIGTGTKVKTIDVPGVRVIADYWRQ